MRNKSSSSSQSKLPTKLIGICALVSIAIGALLILWPNGAQLKNDPQVFQSIDALFTSYTAKNSSMKEKSWQRLENYFKEGRIPDAGWRRLTRCNALVERGEWETAAQDLYRFIESQRGM